MVKGDKVWFTDPDEGLSNDLYTITDISGEVYSLSNKHGNVEAYRHELKRVTLTQVEYDLAYTGGNYDKVGTFVIVCPLDNETIEEAFQRETGIHPMHMIHYTVDFE